MVSSSVISVRKVSGIVNPQSELVGVGDLDDGVCDTTIRVYLHYLKLDMHVIRACVQSTSAGRTVILIIHISIARGHCPLICTIPPSTSPR